MKSVIFLFVVVVLVGCTESSPKVGEKKTGKNDSATTGAPKKSPKDTGTGAKTPKDEKTSARTVQNAKEEMQSRIDRCLGGQPVEKAFDGTIGIWAVGKKIDSLDLGFVVQKTDEDGKRLVDQFTGTIKCTASDKITGKRETRDFGFDLSFKDGAWRHFLR
jgi:hypothetical protein